MARHIDVDAFFAELDDYGGDVVANYGDYAEHGYSIGLLRIIVNKLLQDCKERTCKNGDTV